MTDNVMTGAEVVIVDDAGNEHVFPPTFDPKRAAEIVRARTVLPEQATTGMLEQSTVEGDPVDSSLPPFVAGAVPAALAMAAPSLVSLVNAMAKGTPRFVSSLRPVGRVGLAADVAGKTWRGDIGGVTRDAVLGVAVEKGVPAIAKRLQQATAPAGGTARNALGRFATGRGGLLTRTAGALSRAAGPLGLAAETLFGPGSSGHRPYGETPEKTAQRQADFEREYAELVRRKRPRIK
jgi:hypothetical protein